MPVAGPEGVVDSILRNLRRVFNSGYGDASIDPKYGLPDVRAVARDMPGAIGMMKTAVETAIKRYEPRLDRVHVKELEVGGPNVLHLEITAYLRQPDRKEPVKFDTRLVPQGNVEVERR